MSFVKETERPMRQAIHKHANLLILLVIVVGAWIRITVYGNLALSIGMLDTPSYVQSSHNALSFQTFFMGRRLFTMNVLYELTDSQQCSLITSSNPYLGEEGFRKIQPCFRDIAFLQNILSILGWCLLAWTIGRRMRSIFYKVVIASLILAFGFTPQIAEWDSILSSESLSISLFLITLAVLVETTFQILGDPESASPLKTTILVILWILTFLPWIFVRDVHAYAALVTVALCVPFLWVKKIRKNKSVLAAILILVAVFGFANVTAKASPRWQPSLKHTLNYYILPYPSRLEFFFEHGMPKDSESPEYAQWFADHGISTYGLFLLSHPGFVLSNMLENSMYLRSDFVQPHFRAPEVLHRDALLIFGEIVHPETNAIYIIDLLLLISLCAAAFKRRDKETIAWAWLATWVLSYAAISLFITFFGDIDGTRRHIFPSVETFRLFLWIFLVAQLDRVPERGDA
jgi:hypothetical protein